MRRQIRFPGGKQEWRYIEVRQCPKCGSCDRLLPDDQVPFKYYGEETIRKVIDDALTEDEELEYEDYPCEATKQRWKDWWGLTSFSFCCSLTTNYTHYRIKGYTRNFDIDNGMI